MDRLKVIASRRCLDYEWMTGQQYLLPESASPAPWELETRSGLHQQRMGTKSGASLSEVVYLMHERANRARGIRFRGPSQRTLSAGADPIAPEGRPVARREYPFVW
jgi:hypothetical protein